MSELTAPQRELLSILKSTLQIGLNAIERLETVATSTEPQSTEPIDPQTQTLMQSVIDDFEATNKAANDALVELQKRMNSIYEPTSITAH